MNFEREENIFCFIWKIENFQMNLKKKDEFIKSPCFVVKKFWNTIWELYLFPTGCIIKEEDVDMSCCLNYVDSTSTLAPVEINVSFNLFLTDNIVKLPNYEKCKPINFKKGWSETLIDFKPHATSLNQEIPFQRNDIFIVCYMTMEEDDSFKFNSDIVMLTIYRTSQDHIPAAEKIEFTTNLLCSVEKDLQESWKKIWRFPNKCFARSIIVTERSSFTLSLADILNIADKKHTAIFCSASDIPDLLITIYNTGKSIYAYIKPTKIKFENFRSVCKISICDFLGNIQCSISENYCFTDSNCNNFKLHLKINDFMQVQHSLEQNFLNLYCEIANSKGNVLSWIEKTSNVDFLYKEFTHEAQAPTQLQAKIADLYSEDKFCDVVLYSRDKEFKTHKVILGSHSRVFSAMINSDIEEKGTNTISLNVKDLDSNTLDRMLLFMYTERLEDINFEVAIQLYEAAYKYEIVHLHEKSVTYIISNLTVENASSTLCLGAMRYDQNLKRAITNFILQHANEVLYTREWKEMSEGNVHLANEVLQKICETLLPSQKSTEQCKTKNNNLKLEPS